MVWHMLTALASGAVAFLLLAVVILAGPPLYA